MTSRDEQKVVVTAFISALVEGVRGFGPLGVDEDRLYASLAARVDRRGFDMIVTELLAQKTLKYKDPHTLVYCGPSPLDKPQL